MREPFKRAAKVTLSIRKADKAALREALASAIKPMVDYFASELTALAMRRLDEELERIGQAVHVAVSAFATELEAPQQLPVKGQTSDIPARAGGAESKSASTTTPVSEADDSSRGAPRASGNGGFVRGGVILRAPRVAVPEPAVAAVQGSTSSTPTDEDTWCRDQRQYVKGAPFVGPGLIETALGPDIARALGEPVSDRYVKGASKFAGVCSKCKQPGHNARSCGREPKGHRSKSERATAPASATLTVDGKTVASYERATVTIAVPPPPVRAPAPSSAPYDTAKAKVDRLAMLRARNAERPADAPLARAGEDDNPNAAERWTREEIDEETAAAEARKPTGELPEPSSSWGF